MLTIHLQQLRFIAFHGLYDEEKIIGNNFIVDVAVSYLPTTATINQLHQTINYVEVYNIVKTRMESATPLLETIVTEIAQQIFDTFSQAQHVNICIKKENPPIENFCGSVAVEYNKKRE